MPQYHYTHSEGDVRQYSVLRRICSGPFYGQLLILNAGDTKDGADPSPWWATNEGEKVRR